MYKNILKSEKHVRIVSKVDFKYVIEMNKFQAFISYNVFIFVKIKMGVETLSV